MNRNHHRNDSSLPTGSSSSIPFSENLRCGTFRLCALPSARCWCDSRRLDDGEPVGPSDARYKESGRGGAGASGIGNGVTVVMPRSGVGGGVMRAFFGGNGGVTEIWRSKTTRGCSSFVAVVVGLPCERALSCGSVTDSSAFASSSRSLPTDNASRSGAFSSILFNSW